MNSNIREMLKVCEGRHLTQVEQKLYQQYYESLPVRLKALKEVQEKEESIVNEAMNAYFESETPPLNNKEGKDKGYRDMLYLLRAAANAMVQQDMITLAEKAQFVYEIFDNLGFAQGSMDIAFEYLRKTAKAHLSDLTWEHMELYLNALSETRLNHLKRFKQAEQAIINDGVQFVLETWPEIDKMNAPEENIAKDMQSLFEAVSMSMLGQKKDPLIQKKTWLYAYFQTLRFSMEMVYKTYETVPEFVAKYVPEDTYQAYKPYLEFLANF